MRDYSREHFVQRANSPKPLPEAAGVAPQQSASDWSDRSLRAYLALPKARLAVPGEPVGGVRAKP